MLYSTGSGYRRCSNVDLSRRSRRNASGRKRRDLGESFTNKTGHIQSKEEGKGEKSACGSVERGDRIFPREAEVDGNAIIDPGSKRAV